MSKIILKKIFTREARLLWLFRFLIAMALGFILFLVLAPMTGKFVYFIASGALLILIVLAYIFLFFELSVFKMAVLNNQLHYSNGVVFKKYTKIEFSKVQYLNYYVSPLEKSFGLCSIVVVMAGSRVILPTISKEEAIKIFKGVKCLDVFLNADINN